MNFNLWDSVLRKVILSRQNVLVMKLCCFFMIIGCLQIHAAGTAQRVSLSFKQASLESVLKEIKSQTGLLYWCDQQVLKQAKPITVDVKDVDLSQALRVCLKDQKLSFSIDDQVLVISPTPPDKRTDGDGTSLLAVFPVAGVVHDAEGVPVANVSVSVKNSKTSTSTDDQGRFSLNVNVGDILVFTSIGFERTEITIKNTSSLTITLSKSVSTLDDVQIIAYGETSKRFLVGNISTVKAADIEKQPVQNPLLALQGRVPGIMIEQATGLPGSGVTVRIQGQNSLSYGSDPLYVIDGVPYPAHMLPTLNDILGSSGFTPSPSGSGNPLSFIDPAQIESIDILKDADATSIYGSRAAAGAVLITTKKGKSGPTRVEMSFQKGWGRITRKLDVLNTQQYLQMRRQAKANDNREIEETDFDLNGTWDSTRYTDWQKELIGGTANYADARASMSGGSSTTNFLLSSGYHRETTVFPGDLANQKGSVHFNLNNISPNNRFRAQFSGTYMFDNNKIIGVDLTGDAVKLSPNAPALYNENGELNWHPVSGSSTWNNPLAHLNKKYKVNTHNLISNLLLSYELLEGLHIKSNLSYSSLRSDEVIIYPSTSWAPEFDPFPVSSFGHGAINTWQLEPQLTYTKRLGKGVFNALAGSTILKTTSNRQSFDATGFASDAVLEDIRAAAEVTVSSTTASVYRYAATFGRLTYNLSDRYILNGSIRRDGSSRFGSENLYNTFWSFAGAWIFTGEPFVQKTFPFLSFGKIRASYGTTGNDQIGEYGFMNLYESRPQDNNYQGITSLHSLNLPNPYLQWEETRKLQAGLDVGIFHDRLFLTANYYRNRSSNQLQSYVLPSTTGYEAVIQNFPATIQNSGWELSLSARLLEKNALKWSINANLTIPKNKLDEFPNFESSSVANRLIIGQPITIRKVYDFAGVDAATGLYQFYDKEGNLTSSPGTGFENRIKAINTAPKFYGGWQNTFTYGGLQLDILVQYVKQLGLNTYFGDFPGRFFGTSNVGNQPAFVFDAWSKEGDQSSHQKFSTTYPTAIRNALRAATQSDAAWADASYLRLKNLSLSWQLPQQLRNKIHLQQAKIFLQAQNLFTVTDFQGMDPESRNLLSLPPLRIVTAGIQLVL